MRTRSLTLFFLFATMCPATACADEVRTLVMSFGGDRELGRAIATIFHLQLSTSLRKAPSPNPRELNFGEAAVLWQVDVSGRTSLEEAEKRTQTLNITAQHVLWGHVHSSQTNAVVTAYLAVPRYSDLRSRQPEIWSLNLDVGGMNRSLTVDIPRRYYEFEPIIVSGEFIEGYRNRIQFELLSAPGRGKRIGYLGDDWTFLRHEGQYSRVRSNGKEGWVFLPELGKHKSEVIDFIAGLIRVYRADWEGALPLFQAVADGVNVPTSIKVDSLLFILRAKSELGAEASEEIVRIRQLAPASRQAAQYIVMYGLARCFGRERRCSGSEEKELGALLERTKRLFLDGDEWHVEAQRVVRSRADHPPGGGGPLVAEFPAGKPIEMTVMFGPGSVSDITARRLADGMARFLGAPVPVVNRTGAGGAVAYRHVAQQRPDGYSIIWNSNNISTAFHLGQLPFGNESFDPVARVSVENPALVVRGNAPWRTLRDLIDYTKANPGKLNVGNSGIGTHTHIASAALFSAGGTKATSVSLGGGQVAIGVLSGSIDAAVLFPQAVAPSVKNGDLRVLAMLGSMRDPIFPDVPTAREQGFDVGLDLWRGIAAPKGTPKEVIAKLQDAIRKTVESPDFQEAGRKIGFMPAYQPADAFRRTIAEDDRRLAALIREIGIRN